MCAVFQCDGMPDERLARENYALGSFSCIISRAAQGFIAVSSHREFSGRVLGFPAFGKAEMPVKD